MKRQSQYFYSETDRPSTNEDEKLNAAKCARVEATTKDVPSNIISSIKSDEVTDKENTQNECSYAFACIEEIVNSTHAEIGSIKNICCKLIKYHNIFSAEMYESVYAIADKFEQEARERVMGIQELLEIIENEHLQGSKKLRQVLNLYSKLG